MNIDEKIQAWRGMTKQELWKKYTPRLLSKEITHDQYDQILSYGKESSKLDKLQSAQGSSAQEKTNSETVGQGNNTRSAQSDSVATIEPTTRSTGETLVAQFGGYEVSEPEGKSQKSKILNVLSDNQPHTVGEIFERVYGVGHKGYGNVHGRVTDLRKDGHNIPDAQKNDNGEWYYQIINQQKLT